MYHERILHFANENEIYIFISRDSCANIYVRRIYWWFRVRVCRSQRVRPSDRWAHSKGSHLAQYRQTDFMWPCIQVSWNLEARACIATCFNVCGDLYTDYNAFLSRSTRRAVSTYSSR